MTYWLAVVMVCGAWDGDWCTDRQPKLGIFATREECTREIKAEDRALFAFCREVTEVKFW